MRASQTVSPSPVTNPLRAYSRDLDARQGATTLGPSDALWLELALALYRLAGLGPDARAAYVIALGDPEQAIPADIDDSSDQPDASPIRVPSLLLDLAQPGDDASRFEALSVLQGIVVAMENDHAFHLAFATLSAARRALPDLPALPTGRLMAQQGRVARQLGDLETAADLYAMVRELGTLHEERELLVRGHVGAGLIAETRGNFPEARRQYHLTLEHAEAAPRVAAAAHHGLMIVASRAGDIGTAFRHAWAGFELVAGDPVRRIDLLINLAELARAAGEARVALRAFGTALEHTDLSRLRLPAIGGAAKSAAALGDRSAVMSLGARAEREAAASGIPYENAKLWLELAEAFLELDDVRRAADYARRAGEIAESHAFHELDIRAAELAQGIVGRGDRGSFEESDATARDILRRLDALADAGRAVVVG